jgi:hypothetical protein
VRKEFIQRDDRDADEKVEVDCTRVNIGGDGRDGEGGRDGDRARGEGGPGRRGVTLTDCTPDGGGANGLSEVASLSASSNGSRTLDSMIVLTGSSTAPNIGVSSLFDCGGGCGCGVVVPEGTADSDDDRGGDDDCDGACSCQYMGSSSCSNSSASNPC